MVHTPVLGGWFVPHHPWQVAGSLAVCKREECGPPSRINAVESLKEYSAVVQKLPQLPVACRVSPGPLGRCSEPVLTGPQLLPQPLQDASPRPFVSGNATTILLAQDKRFLLGSSLPHLTHLSHQQFQQLPSLTWTPARTPHLVSYFCSNPPTGCYQIQLQDLKTYIW